MTQIRLLTFNTFLRPPPVKTNQDDYKFQRFHDILQQLDNFHIVCFQQLFQTGSFRIETLVQEGIKKGFSHFMISQCPQFWEGPATDSGLCVLSKFPILESKFESYSLGVLSDAASDKGYIYCKINVNGSILHLFNTHLQASYNSSSNHQEKQVAILTRFAQVKMLRNRIIEILNKNHQKEDLVLLVGDLNVNARLQPFTISENSVLKVENPLNFNEYEEVIKLLEMGNMFKVEDLLLENYGSHPVTFGEYDKVLTAQSDWGSKQRLDYIMHLQFPNEKPVLRPITKSCVVQQLKVQDRPYIQLSDHYGVSIKLQTI